MAGSRADFIYTDDANIRYALNLDESNSRAVIRRSGSTTDVNLFSPATAPFPGRPPTSFRPRAINAFNQANPRERRVFKVGNPAAYAVAITGAAEIRAERVGPDEPTPDVGTSTIVWVVSSARPERRGVQPNFTTDTGLDDGTPAAGG